MAGGEIPATTAGYPGLLAHDESDKTHTRKVIVDNLGTLRCGGGANRVGFTYADGKIATMDVRKSVNGVNVTKRYTFTWDGDDLTTIEVSEV